ncbi:hypothetical protein [Streptomyces sp. NPDC020951]|uniref:hypothetical protein n=1 Tax=Streptomyces sp. NPDC020951 TaxID=3365104 RepID=UPI00379ABDBC
MPDVTPRTSTSTSTSANANTRTAPVDHGGPLLPDDEGKRIALRMRHAVVGFVDGPRDAVVEADQALEELAARLTEAMARRRRTLRRSWQPTTDGADDRPATAAPAATTATTATATTAAATVDTEQLRLALRDYRELTERLLRL